MKREELQKIIEESLERNFSILLNDISWKVGVRFEKQKGLAQSIREMHKSVAANLAQVLQEEE
jgi:RNase P/RNase MRP subunit POP5